MQGWRRGGRGNRATERQLGRGVKGWKGGGGGGLAQFGRFGVQGEGSGWSDSDKKGQRFHATSAAPGLAALHS